MAGGTAGSGLRADGQVREGAPAARTGRVALRAVVEAMSRYELSLGHEPQYRCQLDLAGSRVLADAVGFIPLGTWDVALPRDDRDGERA